MNCRFYGYIIFTVCLISACDGLPFPWPGDREALRNSCGLALRACNEQCREIDDCITACNEGFDACVINIEEDPPRDWQPADAFYDGCTDSCNDDLCSAACTAGQKTAAVNSADRLRKYGTIANL